MRKISPKGTLSQEKMYDLILRPIVTEKSASVMSLNQYTFAVRKEATKGQIKSAIEKIFDVEVEKVNTLTHKGKTKKFRGRIGIRSDMKKAIVTVKQGQEIELSVGS